MKTKFSILREKNHHEVLVSFQDHWVVLLRPFFEYALGWFIYFFLFLSAYIFLEVSTIISGSIILFSTLLLFLFNHRFFTTLIDWEISTWIITKDLVIDFENRLYTRNDVIFISIHEVHEIEKKVRGFWSNFLDYGDVHVNVPAAPYPIVCTDIPHPDVFINLIEALRDNRLQEDIDIQALTKAYGNRLQFLLSKV